MKADLTSIKERIERASGPDQGWLTGGIIIDIYYAFCAETDDTHGNFLGRLARLRDVGAHTDAALAFVERLLPGWRWERRYDSGQPFMRLTSPTFAHFEWMGARNPEPSSGWCYGATPALALLSALITSLSQNGDDAP